VVIAILAILSVVAVRSLSGVEDQSHYDATRNQMASIGAAVVGNPGAVPTDVSAPIFSFVSDVGRLPLAVGADPTTQLQELWINPNNLPPLLPRQATTYDLDVWVTSGWRGGYLQLGVGQTSVADGWGNPFDLLHADGVTVCANGDPIEVLRSRGANPQTDTPTTTGFDAYQYLAYNSTVQLGSVPPTNRYLSTFLTGSVYFYDSYTGQLETPNPANGNVVVTLFGAGLDPTTNYVSAQSATITISTTGGVTYSIPNVTVGQRVLRAYQWQGTGQPPLTTTPAFRSIPVRMVVQPGVQMKDLVMLSTGASTATTQPATPSN